MVQYGPAVAFLGCEEAWEGMAPAKLSLPLQVMQLDLEEASGLQGAGEGAHLCGNCREDAGEGLPLSCPGAGRMPALLGTQAGMTTVTAEVLAITETTGASDGLEIWGKQL